MQSVIYLRFFLLVICAISAYAALPTFPLITGLGGVIGSDYLPYANELVFVEYDGKLSSIRLQTAIVSSGTTVLRGTYSFNFDTGADEAASDSDVFWEQVNQVIREMVPLRNARIVNIGNIGAAKFDRLTSTSLQEVIYGTTPINGDNNAGNKLVNGDVFAVLTNGGNLAKVLVTNYGYDITFKWVTYKLNPTYQILGEGYNQPEDVVTSADRVHVYITERSGDLVRAQLTNGNRAAATVVSQGLNAPQQLALDETHSYAYVVEFASPGRLLRIDLHNGAKTTLIGNLQYAIGLLVTPDGETAYVTEQLSNNVGRLSRINLTTKKRQVLYTSSTAPLFFLTWANPSQSAILVTERDPANKVWLIDLTRSPPIVSQLSAPVPPRPSSVAVVFSSFLLVSSDSIISALYPLIAA
ncbi:hypothetical protein BC937DRAFT_89520 [Endogone sp. FLAS-F59071]|nr:hypothetical protein BC937DRAFT_89520 [Endogone sp. FLAS-F59071]|eukprot:RUS17758.1 hypothetical protein BC937DRAFT_89520 [Endogone sp. FLAS-F59071]